MTQQTKIALSRCAVALLCAGIAAMAHAEDLGKYGNVWGIAEKDGVAQIKDKLVDLKNSGELDKRMNQARSDIVQNLTNPAPIKGIRKAAANASRTFDSSIVVKQDVKDDKGRVVVRAGTRVNPLEMRGLSKALLFIDGRDRAQVAWVKKRIASNPKDKVILVGGNWRVLSGELKRVVYFDQQGAMTKRFGIRAVPTVISQAGSVLKIEEVVAK